MTPQTLLELIEQKRTEMIQIAMLHGFTSSIAIAFSQELDKLLNEYNRLFIQKTPNR